MERRRRAAGSALLALLCVFLRIASTTAQCDPGCIGNGSISCMTCSEWCGICSEIGHVDRCNQFGTVHLSLDDGPRGTTPGVLDTLKKYNISASFWVIANLIKGREATLQRIDAEGHYIGDHTWSHPYMNEIYDRNVVEGEVENSRAEIRRVFPNRAIPAYRPPYGEMNSNTRRIIEGLSYRIVVWNLDTLDWMGNMSIIAENVDSVMSGTDPASNSWIILMHVTEKIGVCALPAVIERIRYRGYKFVSADECFGTASLSSTPLNPEVYAWRQTQLAFYNGSSQPCVPQYMQGQVFGLNCSAGVSCYEGMQCCGPDNSCASDDWACGDGCLSGACASCRPMWYPQPTNLPKPLDWPEQSTCPDVPTDATVGGDPNGGGGGDDDDGNPGGMSTQLLVIIAVAATAVVIAVGLVIRRKRATPPAPAQPPAPNNDQPGAAVDAEGAVANAGGAVCGEGGVGEPKMLQPPSIDVFASAIAAATASSLVLASPPTASTVFSPTPGPAPEFGNASSDAYGSGANHRPASSPPSAPRANAGAYSALAMKSPDATVPAMNRRPAQTPTGASSGSASDSKSPSRSRSRSRLSGENGFGFSVDRGGNNDSNAIAANPAAAVGAAAPVRRPSRRGSRSVSGVRGDPTLTAMSLSMSMALESSPRALPLHHHEPGMPAPTAFGESPATAAAEFVPATPTGQSPQ